MLVFGLIEKIIQALETVFHGIVWYITSTVKFESLENLAHFFFD